MAARIDGSGSSGYIVRVTSCCPPHRMASRCRCTALTGGWCCSAMPGAAPKPAARASRALSLPAMYLHVW